MGNNNDVVFTDTDRLLLQKDEEVSVNSILADFRPQQPILLVVINQLLKTYCDSARVCVHSLFPHSYGPLGQHNQ